MHSTITTQPGMGVHANNTNTQEVEARRPVQGQPHLHMEFEGCLHCTELFKQQQQQITTKPIYQVAQQGLGISWLKQQEEEETPRSLQPGSLPDSEAGNRLQQQKHRLT